MEKYVKDWLSQFNLPCFFDEPLPAGLEDIHQYITASLKGETTTVNIEMPQELYEHLKQKMAKIGWTFDEVIVLFFMWAIYRKEVSENP